MDPASPPLLSLSPQALSLALGGPGRAAAIFGLLRRGRDPFAPELLGPRAQERLRASSSPTQAQVIARSCAVDRTIKAQLRTGAMAPSEGVESVLIPTPRRSTLCVSSQVGCARGCIFCLTGTMGLKRGLRTEEILTQVSWGLMEVEASALPPLRNLVFMGMGEPLDNLSAVIPAVSLLTNPSAWAFSPRHVTVSTVGPSIQAIREVISMPAQLAWSVHAARDEIRKQLVPTARASVQDLRDAFGELLEHRARLRPQLGSLFVELTLLDGINDSAEDAEALVELLRPLPGQTRVNLLPMNPIGNGLRPSSPTKVLAFAAIVREQGFFCSVRTSRGDDERAACGQLAVGPPRRRVKGRVKEGSQR